MVGGNVGGCSEDTSSYVAPQILCRDERALSNELPVTRASHSAGQGSDALVGGRLRTAALSDDDDWLYDYGVDALHVSI